MKRLISFLTVVMLGIFFVPYSAGAKNSAESSKGDWVRVDIQEYYDEDDSSSDFDPDDYESLDYSVFSGTHSYRYDKYKNLGDEKGSMSTNIYMKLMCDFISDDSDFAPDIASCGQTVKVKLSISADTDVNMFGIDESFKMAFASCDADEPMRSISKKDKVLLSMSSLEEDSPSPVEASVTFPKSAKNGDRFAFSFRTNHCETRWIYEWKADEADEEVSNLGQWQLIDTDVHVPEEERREDRVKYPDGPDDVYSKTLRYKGTETTHDISAEEDEVFGQETFHKHYEGEWSIRFSSTPPAVLTGGQVFELGIVMSRQNETSNSVVACIENTELGAWHSYKGDVDVKALEKFSFRGSNSVNAQSTEQTVKIEAPAVDNPGGEKYCGLRFISYVYISGGEVPDAIYTDYIYVWSPKGGAGAASATDENGGTDSSAHAEVIKDAAEKKGEDREGIPPAAIAGILAGAAALGGAAAAVRRKKKKNGSESAAGSNNNDKKDDPLNSRYEMRIQKDFGNTISAGDEVILYARIVEITESGSEKSRDDLTQRITVSSPEYLEISRVQMSGHYKAAAAFAPTGKPNEVPGQAVVSFCLAGAQGSFTEKVVFNISNPCIVFGQENLTLPAEYKKTAELPFLVYGVEKPEVKLTIIGSEYEVKLRDGEKRAGAEMYYADLTEAKCEPLEVGESSQTILVVTAKYTGKNGKVQKLEERFSIYRMGMGIALDVSDIGCYLTKDNNAAVTKAHMMLITWDEKDNKVVRVAVAPKSFRAVHWSEENGKNKDYFEQEAQIIDALKVAIRVPENAKIDAEKGLECEILCKGAVLDKPQMLRCAIEITAEYNETIYSSRKDYVLLSSQPVRTFGSYNAEQEAVKKDRQIKESLERILAAINSYGMEAQYHSMVVLIKIMLDNYQFKYGYDEELVNKIHKVYSNLLSNLKAMDELECSRMDELEKSFFGRCTIVADYAKQCEDSMGLGKRMLLGVCTLGTSEAALLTCQVYREMNEAAINCKGDSAFDMWCTTLVAGVKVVAIEALIDYASGKAMTYGKQQLSKLKAGKPDIKAANKAAKALNGNTDTSIVSKLNTKEAANLKYAGEQSAAAAKEAAEAVEKAVSKARKLALGEADEAFERGVELGRKKLEKLAAAEGNEFVEQALSVQMDKYSMTAMKRMKGDAATELRAKFNKVIMKKNEDAIKMTKAKLAKELKCTSDQIKTFKASSNTPELLKSGKTTTFDLDVTYQYVDKNGVINDVNQQFASRIHNESCYQAWHGTLPPTNEAAKNFAIGVDHSVIQKGALENYGSVDVLEKIIDKSRQGELMTSKEAARAGETIAEKGLERLRRCEEWLKKALTGDTPQVREAAFKAAAMEKAEGFRQIVKQADYLMSKDIIGMSRGSATCISPKMRFAWETMRKVGDGTLSPDIAEKLIKETCGMDAVAICKETGNLLSKINNSLAGTAESTSVFRSVYGWFNSENQDLI